MILDRRGERYPSWLRSLRQFAAAGTPGFPDGAMMAGTLLTITAPRLNRFASILLARDHSALAPRMTALESIPLVEDQRHGEHGSDVVRP
jgi:hypothetical protein